MERHLAGKRAEKNEEMKSKRERERKVRGGPVHLPRAALDLVAARSQRHATKDHAPGN